MPSNAEHMIPQIRTEFAQILAYVTGSASRDQPAYTMEVHRFRSVLRLGLPLLRLFFATRTAERPPAPQAADGTRLKYHERRSIRYTSVFGMLRVTRHYFTAPGQPGVCPVDAELSLPATSYSDLLREWGSFGNVDGAYRETQALLIRILDLPVGVATLETQTQHAAQDGDAFYTAPPTPDHVIAAGSILVVQAEGKGAPMVQPPAAPPGRLGKGQQRTRKQAAV